MINLIKNECIKIFKKKSIYITLLITLIFIIACNFIYKYEGQNSDYNVGVDIAFYEEMLKDLNPNNKEDLEEYLMYKTEIDTAKLIQNYGDSNTWQAQIIRNKVNSIISQMNYYQYDAKNKVEYENMKKQYDILLQKINAGDWRHFAKEELIEIENNLLEQNQLKKQAQTQMEIKNIENQIYELELQKQVTNWRLEKDIPYGYNYQNTCLRKYQNAKMQIKDYEDSNNQEDYSQKQEYYNNLEIAAISQYDIEHQTEAGSGSDARGILLNVFNQFEIFIIIMIIMIAGTIVSEEFSKGTIKLLLIKPYKRTTILASKLITCLILIVIIILAVLSMQFIVGGLVQGFESFHTPAIVYNHNTNQLEEINIVSYLGMQAVGKMPIYILLMTLAFCISTIFTNSALAITIGLLGYMGSSFINQIGLILKLWWLKFFVTPNWDLTQYLFGGLPKFEGLTIGFSLVIIIVYMLIMLIPTFILFKKKNIKNI